VGSLLEGLPSSVLSDKLPVIVLSSRDRMSEKFRLPGTRGIVGPRATLPSEFCHCRFWVVTPSTALKMETLCFSETLVPIYKFTGRYSTEEHFYLHCHDNFTSHTFLPLLLAPSVMVRWLIFLIHIREVPGSDLGSETGYPMIGYLFEIRPRRLPSKSFQIHHNSLIALILRCIALVTEKSVLK
jgi:hypothetical protein